MDIDIEFEAVIYGLGLKLSVAKARRASLGIARCVRTSGNFRDWDLALRVCGCWIAGIGGNRRSRAGTEVWCARPRYLYPTAHPQEATHPQPLNPEPLNP